MPYGLNHIVNHVTTSPQVPSEVSFQVPFSPESGQFQHIAVLIVYTIVWRPRILRCVWSRLLQSHPHKQALCHAGFWAHIYVSTDGGRTMQDITENVAQSKGMNLGGHTPVPYFVGEGALLAFDNGQVSFNQGDMTKFQPG